MVNYKKINKDGEELSNFKIFKGGPFREFWDGFVDDTRVIFKVKKNRDQILNYLKDNSLKS